MCRWIAYFSEEPILLTDVIERPDHSLLKQIDEHYLPGIQHPAADSGPGPGTANAFTNVDGWGLAWYSSIQAKYRTEDELEHKTGKVVRRVELPALMPTVLRSTMPPLHDLNLRSVCKTTESSIVFGHIRAAVGTPVSIPNCHPFVFGRWSFMHNGSIGGFFDAQDELRSKLSRSAKMNIQGSTDTEVAAALFFTYLAEGHDSDWLDEKPLHFVEECLARAVRTIVHCCTSKAGWYEKDGKTPRSWVSLNLAITDGESFVALRYAYPPERPAPSLYWSSTEGSALDRRYKGHPSSGRHDGDLPAAEHLPHVVVASEPMTRDTKDKWHLLENGQILAVERKELRAVYAQRRTETRNNPDAAFGKGWWKPQIKYFAPVADDAAHRRLGLGRHGLPSGGVRLRPLRKPSSGRNEVYHIPPSVMRNRRTSVYDSDADFPVLPHTSRPGSHARRSNSAQGPRPSQVFSDSDSDSEYEDGVVLPTDLIGDETRR
ncbi:hypothetical protein JCM11641_004765 [Rhodosporidiobolus odoratus]